MTKEEILEKHCNDSYGSGAYLDISGDTIDGNVKCVLTAMDEYANQRLEDFVIFLEKDNFMKIVWDVRDRCFKPFKEGKEEHTDYTIKEREI